MCSIIGSFNREKIKQLAELNAYRGQHSHSVYVFDEDSYDVIYSHRGIGPLDLDQHELPAGYIVVHQQAPTTDNKDESSIHPAQIGKHLLWHNGIVKAEAIKCLQRKFNSTVSWDTKLILLSMIYTDNVQDIDGTFSCLYYDCQKLVLFRNEISPMFYDHNGNISSTKFENSLPLPPNVIWKFNPRHVIFDDCNNINMFATVENPYFFMDDNK